MTNVKIANVVGALALALSDDLVRAAEAEASEAGPAAAALVLAGHDPGLSIERLRRSLGLSHPGAVRLVDRLAADGLMERQTSSRDRRAVALHLTAEGGARVDAILSARQGGLARALDALSPDERATFGALTEKVLRALLRGVDHAYSVCRLCEYGACRNCPVDAEMRARG
jgi:DNA-binding MarR family transcriptional regulator